MPGVGAWAPWAFATVATAGAATAAGLDAQAARGAADQDWSPFVLVAGLLLVGLVVNGDGLFAAAGRALSALARSEPALLGGTVVLLAAVTAVLNLDTSVAFVTPVVVHAVRRRPGPRQVPVAACLLLSNAGSLLLPGANLTNLIVLGGAHLSGGAFLVRAAPAWAAALVATTAVVAVARARERRAAHDDPTDDAADADPAAHLGVGLVAAVTVAVLVVALPDAALPVLGVGLAAVAVRLAQRRLTVRQAVEVLGPGVLLGLFALAVALGTLARTWTGPAHLLAHAGSLPSAALGAGAAVVVNNLPAASLLGAGHVAHPVALLVGLDVGPNLFVTGSLSWILWRRAARQAGDEPSVAGTVRLGLVAAPLALLAAVGLLVLLA